MCICTVPCNLKNKVYDDEVLKAATSNKPSVVSKWLQALPVQDINARTRIVHVLKKAAQCLSVDVIKQFKAPSKNNYHNNVSSVYDPFYLYSIVKTNVA